MITAKKSTFKMTFYFLCASLLLVFSTGHALAAKTPESLVPFQSSEGRERLIRSKWNGDFFQLANHFEGQPNGIFCGPTTAAIVLNAFRTDQLRAGKIKLKPDTQMMKEEDKAHIGEMNILFNRYTANNIFDTSYRSWGSRSVKSRSDVMGAPNKKGEQDFGFQLSQFAQLLKAHGLKVKKQNVTDKMTVDQMRATFQKSLSDDKSFAIVNYTRKALGQPGGGHISPVGAYDESSDSFLVMDVNPNRADWVWIESKKLFEAMNTFDTVENRGFVIVSD